MEAALDRPYEALTVTTFHGFCAQLLRDEAAEAGVDPFAVPVTQGDRLAMLLERIDELPLTHHDLRGNPSAVLGAVVGRIDRLKDELVTASDYAAWATDAREREFADIYAAHDRMLAETGTLDHGDLLLHAFRLLRERPHVRARLESRFVHVLVDDLQDVNFAQGLLLRMLNRNLVAAGDDDQAIFRVRGAATKNLREFEGASRAAGAVAPRSGHDPRRAPRRSSRRWRTASRRRPLDGPARTARSRSGPPPTSAPRPRPSPPTSSA